MISYLLLALVQVAVALTANYYRFFAEIHLKGEDPYGDNRKTALGWMYVNQMGGRGFWRHIGRNAFLYFRLWCLLMGLATLIIVVNH